MVVMPSSRPSSTGSGFCPSTSSFVFLKKWRIVIAIPFMNSGIYDWISTVCAGRWIGLPTTCLLAGFIQGVFVVVSAMGRCLRLLRGGLGAAHRGGEAGSRRAEEALA